MDLETIDERPERTERMLNFSRPRPLSYASYDSTASVLLTSKPTTTTTTTTRTSTTPRVRSIEAFQAPPRSASQERPDDEDASVSSDRASTPTTESVSELTWDSERGAYVPKTRAITHAYTQHSFNDQRSPAPPLVRGSSASSLPRAAVLTATVARPGSSSENSSLLSGEPLTTLPSTYAPVARPSSNHHHHHLPPPPPKGILKRSSVSQQSEHDSAFGGGGVEDAASHHTVSEDGTSSFDTSSSSADGANPAKWSSSDYDVSALSEKQRRKLEKRGINPALYLEMKAARGGRKGGFGKLTGNGFVG